MRNGLHRCTRYRADVTRRTRQLRGVFGTSLAGGRAANAWDIVPKNTANTAPLYVGGRLFALMEAGQAWEVDPATLGTLGPSTLGGAAALGAPFALEPAALQGPAEAALSALRVARWRAPWRVRLGGDAVSAHYRSDPVSGRLIVLTYQVWCAEASRALTPMSLTIHCHELTCTARSLHVCLHVPAPRA
jgi:carotenoid cleavage dioxygenase-like enzyme